MYNEVRLKTKYLNHGMGEIKLPQPSARGAEQYDELEVWLKYEWDTLAAVSMIIFTFKPYHLFKLSFEYEKKQF